MKKEQWYKILTYGIALVWLVMGMVKFFDFAPRHGEIVARILGDEYARTITILIGLAEMIMAVWVWSRFKAKLNATLQIIVVLSMNVLEFLMASDLLMWGKINSFYALLFVGVVYYHEFVLGKQINATS